MMKLVAIALTILLLSCWVLSPADANEDRLSSDATGRKWVLNGWESGSRPYEKDLGTREKLYQEKWGETWYGPQVAQRIYSPGDWNWEVYHTVPKDMAAQLKRSRKRNRHLWGSYTNVMTFVWSSGGRDITDVYVACDSSFYHYDPSSGASIFIGDPEKKGERDGINGEALLDLRRLDSALDHVTGRLYFTQIGGNKNLRYVEKLLPYRSSRSEKIYYLPALLDVKKLYEKVKSPSGGKLKPLTVNGKRGNPVFVVRTNKMINVRRLPGPNRGNRLLITANGRGLYYSKGGRKKGSGALPTFYDSTSLFKIDTGKALGGLNIRGIIPENLSSDGPGTHGGNNVGFDGNIYTSQHGGAGGGSGRMFSMNPDSGTVTMLYDSMPQDGPWKKGMTAIFDGPADAASLWFTSTLWQTQCPRTGAIINGGWDNAGIRRYLDGFVTTIAGHYYRGNYDPSRPGWNRGFVNVQMNSNPAIAFNGDLYIADVNNELHGRTTETLFTEPRIVRIYRTDWPVEQPVNGYADTFFPKEKIETLQLEYAKKYIGNYKENNSLLEKAGY